MLSDPQVLARDMVLNLPHPNVPDLRVAGSPLKLTETPPSVRYPPPLLGQHNEEVLTKLGYNAKEISRLRESGVIGKSK